LLVSDEGAEGENVEDARWSFVPGAVTFNANIVPVRGIQYRLLKGLAESDIPLTEDELVAHGWGHDQEKETKTLQNTMSGLRKSLEKSLGHVLRGVNPISICDTGPNRAWVLADVLRYRKIGQASRK